MCNCDVHAEALTELPGEDLYALDDTKFVAALEGMGVDKAPPLGIHFGVSNEWQTLALTPTFSETFLERYGRFITPEHREFFDPEPRRYNFPIMTSLEDGRLPPPLSDHAFALNPPRLFMNAADYAALTDFCAETSAAQLEESLLRLRVATERVRLERVTLQSRAPAFIRHLGESEEQVAMLLAQMSAPLGSCTCQRINGFLFACLACSKAGKS